MFGNGNWTGGLTLLAVTFSVLKVTGAISWPWSVVLLPVIIPFGFFLFVYAIIGIALTYEARKNAKR